MVTGWTVDCGRATRPRQPAGDCPRGCRHRRRTHHRSLVVGPLCHARMAAGRSAPALRGEPGRRAVHAVRRRRRDRRGLRLDAVASGRSPDVSAMAGRWSTSDTPRTATISSPCRWTGDLVDGCLGPARMPRRAGAARARLRAVAMGHARAEILDADARHRQRRRSRAPRWPEAMRWAGTATSRPCRGRRGRAPTGRSRTPTTAGGRRCSPRPRTTPIRSAAARREPGSSTPAWCCPFGASAACRACSARCTSRPTPPVCGLQPADRRALVRHALRAGYTFSTAVPMDIRSAARQAGP